mmetsp:Transcript_84317/g.212599  ORF Transcript_84317/g.212599 Transcript_84317/m.212599 type:complete len:221 (+) Transcript_84317:1784-2446(+)
MFLDSASKSASGLPSSLMTRRSSHSGVLEEMLARSAATELLRPLAPEEGARRRAAPDSLFGPREGSRCDSWLKSGGGPSMCARTISSHTCALMNSSEQRGSSKLRGPGLPRRERMPSAWACIARRRRDKLTWSTPMPPRSQGPKFSNESLGLRYTLSSPAASWQSCTTQSNASSRTCLTVFPNTSACSQPPSQPPPRTSERPERALRTTPPRRSERTTSS